MTPFEFGYLVGGREKTAAGLFAGLSTAMRTAGKGLSNVDNAARHVVSGMGGITGGAGELVDSVGQSLRGIGVSARRGGRAALRPAPKGRIGIFGDLLGLLGHTAHLGGNVARHTGHGVSWLGNRLSDVGHGIKYVGDNAPMGIPTVAAGGLLAAGANVAPKLPLPGVKFQSPIKVDVNYETRKPVEFRW